MQGSQICVSLNSRRARNKEEAGAHLDSLMRIRIVRRARIVAPCGIEGGIPPPRHPRPILIVRTVAGAVLLRVWGLGLRV